MHSLVHCAVLVLALVALGRAQSQTYQIIDFTLAAKNLPSGKNAFAEIKTPIQCRTETIKDSQNPEWQTPCYVEHQDGLGKELAFDIRNDRSMWPDESIGWARIHTNNMTQLGETVRVGIYDGATQTGIFEATITAARLLPGARH